MHVSIHLFAFPSFYLSICHAANAHFSAMESSVQFQGTMDEIVARPYILHRIFRTIIIQSNGQPSTRHMAASKWHSRVATQLDCDTWLKPAHTTARQDANTKIYTYQYNFSGIIRLAKMHIVCYYCWVHQACRMKIQTTNIINVYLLCISCVFHVFSCVFTCLSGIDGWPSVVDK